MYITVQENSPVPGEGPQFCFFIPLGGLDRIARTLLLASAFLYAVHMRAGYPPCCKNLGMQKRRLGTGIARNTKVIRSVCIYVRESSGAGGLRAGFARSLVHARRINC